MIRILFHFYRRLSASKSEQFFKVGVLTLVLIAFSSSGFMFFELQEKPDLKWDDAFWWSVVTMTTVGYGDFFPTSAAGRYVIGFPTMIFGISILGYLLSTVASFLIEARSKELKGMSDVIFQDHILIIHYQSESRIRAIIQELRLDEKTKQTPIVIIDDELEELPGDLASDGVRFVRGDASKESSLEMAGYREAASAIILSKDPNDPACDNHNLAAVLTLEQLYPEIHTVAECIDPERVVLMKRAGCDSVVCMASLSSNLLVQEMLDPGVQAVIDQATSNVSGQQFYLVEVDKQGVGKFRDAREQLEAAGFVVMGYDREQNVTLNPDRELQLEVGDRVICLGPHRPPPIRLQA